VDSLLDQLEDLCEQAAQQTSFQVEQSGGKKVHHPLTIQIRILLVSVIRCMHVTGKHLGGLKKDPEELARISYREDQDEIELGETEAKEDVARKESELEHLGAIGYTNSAEPQLKFPDTIAQVEKQSKELVTKLYTGENAKFLVGNDKIPEYLSNFLTQMKSQSEGFRIGCVRDLRTASERLLVICEMVPKALNLNLRVRFSVSLEGKQELIQRQFNTLKRDD